MPSTCFQHREAPALHVRPLPTHRLHAPGAQPLVPTARHGLTSQGPSSRVLLGSPTSSLPRPPQEAASGPAFPLRPCLSCRFSSQGPAPWEPPALIPSCGQPPGCPSVAPALLWSPDSMGPLEGQRRGEGAGWCQEARGQGRPHRTALCQGQPAHTGTPAPGRAPPTWLGQRHDPWEVAARGPQGAVWTEVARVTVSDQRLVPLPRGLGKA